MAKVAEMALLSDKLDQRIGTVADLRSRLGALMQDEVPSTSPLTRLPDEQRRNYEQLFELVYECSANKSAAKSLVDRILLRLAEEA